MNCQDIARILDEQEVDSLLAAEHSDVQAHLATCRDCARDWHVHAQLSDAEIPAVPPELRARYAAQVAGVSDLGARRRSRFVVIGTLIAVAAAAAMLAVQLTGSVTPVAANVDPPRVDSSVSPVASEAPSAAPADGVEEAPQPAKQVPVLASAAPAGLRVLLLPPRHGSTETSARPAIEAFHSSLQQALRRIADVTVEVVDADAANDQSGNRVTVVSPQYTTLSSGQRVYQSGDGRGTWSGGGSRSGAQQWPVEVMLEPAMQGTGNSVAFGRLFGGALAVRLEIGSNGIPEGGFCGGSGINIGIGSTTDFNRQQVICSSVDRLATRLIETLRQKLEPPPSDAAQFAARLRDASLPSMDRQRALSELLNSIRQRGITLDAAALDAITAYVGSLPPDERARSWMRLSGAKQAVLVAPLLDSLQHDGDEKVRLEVLSILAWEYGSDSRVRAALESVARQDVSRFVRMAAQRPISGDAQWHTYVSESLANKALPATQRLAPAIYGMRSMADPAAYERTRSFMGSMEVTSQLLDIFQELQVEVRAAGEDNRSVRAQDDAMRNVLSLLSSTNQSAAIDLQIRILEDPLPNSFVTGQALRTLMERPDDPRVSKVLDNIAAGKAGPELRNSLEMHMAERQHATPFARPRAP